MTRPKIVVLDGYALNPGDLDWAPLEALGDLTVHDRSRGHVVERAAGAPIVLTNKDLVGRDEIEALPDLKYIGVLATGTNIVDLQTATERGIVVTNVPGYGPDSVAQHAIALMLALTSRVGEHAAAVHAGHWSASPDFSFTLSPMTELAGKTLAIIGLGAIGKRVAEIGAALGMKIASVNREGKTPVQMSGIEVTWLPLEELLATADVLTLHCPLTDETHHLINAERLALMKPTALLINTGRGPLIDEPALADALRDGRIGGAGLDVLTTEPPVNGSPLIGCPNAIITPHNAWATVEARERLLRIAADNLAAYLEGTPQNVVA